jgi:PAS domain S-box-containing protein
MRWYAKDCREIPISLNTTLLRNDVGDPIAMLNIARDITERKKLSDALEHRTRQIEMLNRIIGRANVGMMNDEVLQIICNELLAFFSFEHITIVLLDHTRQFLNVYGVIHRVEGVLKRGSRFPLSYSLAKFPIEWMQPVLYNDLDLEREEIKDTIGYRHGVRAFLSVPILFQGEVIGAFSLSSHEKNVFPPNALSILQPIVEQIGFSIEKTRLYTELRNSEEKYRLLVETARDMVFSIDLDGKFQYASPSALSLTGYTVQELLDLGVSDKIVYEEDYRRVKALLRLLKQSRSVVTKVKNIESRIIHKDGSRVWVSISWTPIFDEEGYINGVQGILHDITERKTAEQKINKQLNQLNVLYDFSRRITSSLNPREIGELTYTFAERIIPFDAFFIDMYDQTRRTLTPLISVDSIGGKKVMLPGPFDHIKLDAGTTIFTSIVEKRSVMIDRADDDDQGFISLHQRPSHHTASLIFVPMFSKERVLGVLSIQSSVPELYTNDHLHLIESLANLAVLAIEKATLYEETVLKSIEIQDRNKELDDFTYVVSHDLKEPLLSIEGLGKILFNDFAAVLGEDGADYLHSITESCRRMKTLINDLLELSRLGRMTELIDQVSIEEVIKEIQEDLEFSLRDRNAELLVRHPLPVIMANNTHMKIVFRNLISNALKFNLSTTPHVEIGWDEDPVMFRFWVRDNGIGIDERYFDKIFIIFQRLHALEEYEGTGAGLTIVKKIIDIHKGKIWVTSAVGEGSTFFFTIPKQEHRHIHTL